MQYASYYAPSLFNPTKGIVTGTGLLLTIAMMAIFTAVNFLGIKWLANVNSAIMWWKIAIPILTIIVLVFKWHSGNFGSSAAGGFAPTGAKGVLSAVVGGGVVFAYLGFEQADQLAGEIKNPQKNLPRAIITAVAIGTVIYILLQVVFIARDGPRRADPRLARPACARLPATARPTSRHQLRAVRRVAGLAGLGWLAIILRVDAVVSPVRHRPDLPDLDLPGQLRPGQEPVLPADLHQDRQPGRAVVQPVLRLRRPAWSSCCRSRAGTRWSAW